MKKIEKETTFLGKDTELEGKLTFHGTVRMDSHFKGEISSDGNLIVGEEAMVEANIHICYILIRGEIHGNIIADQRVDIHAPGKVFGTIHAPTVLMDEGTILEGQTHMYQAKDADERKSALIGSDEYIGRPPLTLTGIYGIVTDQNTGDPIRDAKVKYKGVGKRNTKTNNSGYYELVNLKDGKCRLIVKAKGYKKGSAKGEISGEETSKRDFELKPKKRK